MVVMLVARVQPRLRLRLLGALPVGYLDRGRIMLGTHGGGRGGGSWRRRGLS